MKKITKEPCLATKGTPIIRDTLDKEKNTYTRGEKKGKKQKKEPPVGQKNRKWEEMREEKYTEYKRAIWPNYIEYL